MVRDIRFLGSEATLQIRSDRRKLRPYGLAGGKPGGPSCNYLNADKNGRILPSKVTMTVKNGDMVRFVQPGAGGFGNPMGREPVKVLEDVCEHKVSAEAALKEYGVIAS
jgi:N-methylhydantoinase B